MIECRIGHLHQAIRGNYSDRDLHAEKDFGEQAFSRRLLLPLLNLLGDVVTQRDKELCV
jgi:hypothetical protein